MTLDVYLKPSCTSCRKANDLLEEMGFSLTKHDLARNPPSRELLERIVDPDHLDEFINTRSRSYKALELDVSGMEKGEAIERMLREPNLMRRPLVVDPAGNFVFGYEPERWKELSRK